MMESTEVKNAVIDAALAHVAFDGWSEATLRAALTDAGVSQGLGRALFPRGVDLILVAGAEIVCLPRTTKLERREG